MLIQPGACSTMQATAAVTSLFVIGLMRYVFARIKIGFPYAA